MREACDAVEPLLSAHLDGELGAREHQVVLRHLDRCRDCAREAEQLRVVRSLVRSLPVRRLPDGLRPTGGGPDDVRLDVGGAAQLDGVRRGSGARRARASLRAGAGVLTAVALGLVGGAAFALGGQPPADAPVIAVPMDVLVADHLVHTVHAPASAPVPVGLRP
jgi:anti-sigma factor RsiW